MLTATNSGVPTLYPQGKIFKGEFHDNKRFITNKLKLIINSIVCK